MGNGYNIYNATHNYCKLGEILVVMNGEDSLIGRQVFSLINAVYQKSKAALTYGQELIINYDMIRNGNV